MHEFEYVLSAQILHLNHTALTLRSRATEISCLPDVVLITILYWVQRAV